MFQKDRLCCSHTCYLQTAHAVYDPLYLTDATRLQSNYPMIILKAKNTVHML
jgi:hypothetical protein